MTSRTLRYLIVVGGAVVSILLFLLASAAQNTAFLDRYYSVLLGLNVLCAVALLVLVILLLGRLYQRYRRKKFGSRLMARLVFLFAMIGILPGSVIYIVSVQFVSRSIESWFDVRIENALEAGLNLGRASLDAELNTLSARANSLALELSDESESAQTITLSRMHDAGVEASIIGENGQVISSSNSQLYSLRPVIDNVSLLREVHSSHGYASIEGDSDQSDAMTPPPASASGHANGLHLRAIVQIVRPSSEHDLHSGHRYLQLIQAVPSYLADNAEALRVASGEYQERSLARTGLRKIYLVTLTLTLLLAVFGAVVSAFLIASDLAQPLLLLADGTKAVAEGDLSPRPISTTNDELGTLTQSFNTMTRQLSEARASVERNRQALENANAYLESVLGNMSAGVMVFDEQLHLASINYSVKRILHLDLTPLIGQSLASIPMLATFDEVIRKAFSSSPARRADSKSDHWQQQIEIPRTTEDENDPDITLLARGSRLPVGGRAGLIVVFDDISDVISAHRSIAWGEVARRLAHEIKNPLTPIQLSAERLQIKLQGKLDAPEAQLLTRSTTTIVNQVAAMKQMVDDFREYARTPPAVLQVVALNTLVTEILHLYLADDSHDIIHASLDPDLPDILGDPTQLRQVIHNLLQNAQDAVEDSTTTVAPRVDIATETVVVDDSTAPPKYGVRLSIIDNGPGFGAKILPRAFEPYVTSKPRGTGLGLPMVKKIVEEHGGSIDIQNRTGDKGAKVMILLVKLAPTAIQSMTAI